MSDSIWTAGAPSRVTFRVTHLELHLPVVLLAALAVVFVDLHPVLTHQQQVFDKGLKVELAQADTLQFTVS